MNRLLQEIEEIYGIPTGTMRAAISNKRVRAGKVGRIRVIDDEEDSFLRFKANYHPRSSKQEAGSTPTQEK